jgi:hypothetical protein
MGLIFNAFEENSESGLSMHQLTDHCFYNHYFSSSNFYLFILEKTLF